MQAPTDDTRCPDGRPDPTSSSPGNLHLRSTADHPAGAVGKRVKCPACGSGVTLAAEPPRPAAVASALVPSQHRSGLEGLSPEYRIRPGRWFAAA